MGTGGERVKGLKEGKRECVEVIRRLWFEEQDPEPFPPAKAPERKNKERTPMYGEGAADVGPDAQTAKTPAQTSI